MTRPMPHWLVTSEAERAEYSRNAFVRMLGRVTLVPAWIPIVCWVAVVVFAVVVIGLCSYEVVWKLQRLRSDADRLLALRGEFDQLQADIATVVQRGSDLSQQLHPPAPQRSVISSQ